MRAFFRPSFVECRHVALGNVAGAEGGDRVGRVVAGHDIQHARRVFRLFG